MQNYKYCFMLRAVLVVRACSILDLHTRLVRGTVVNTTPAFYQSAYTFSIVSIYTPWYVKALQPLLSWSKSEHGVHMQFVTWIFIVERWRAFVEATSELQ